MIPIYWLILFVIMVTIEIITLGLTTIWFAGGAFVAFLASLFGAGPIVQIILFFTISIILLWLTRPIAIRYFNKKHIKTNAESLVGQTAIVTQTINNVQGQGQVVINGQEWTARSQEEGIVVEKDKKVTIIQISGVKLIVKEMEE